jgi:uncharacterized membrane protein
MSADKQPFLSPAEEQRLLDAIAHAETLTSGELRIVVWEHPCNDPMREAWRQFEALKMRATAERNGVLILLAPKARRFAVIGDEGIHQHCGAAFWTEIAAEMSTLFKAGRAIDGLVPAVGRIGELLSRHFPRKPDDRNELPNTIVRG